MRSAPAFFALLACGVASLAIVSPATAQMVRIPGTSVAMAAPPGFKPSREPPGLANAETGSSIVVAELPQESFAETVAVFASPKTASTRYASQGIRFTRIEPLTIGAAQVPLAVGGQAENGREIRKYIAVMGGPQSSTKTTLITFSLTRADPLSQSDVEAALRSVALGRVLTLDEKVARLTFKFRAVAPFQTVEAEGGTALLGIVDKTGPSDAKPSIMINRAGTTAGPAETPQVSERLLRGLAGFNNAQISEQAPATFAGGQGYFISAVAGNLTLLQFTRVLPGGRYVRLAARGETAALENVRDAVKEIASSVEIPEQ